MATTPIEFMQSKFYSPAFDAAIFDGPIKIYFSQQQEGPALDLYFRIQKRLKETYEKTKTMFDDTHKTLFVMLYPNSESFHHSFDKTPQAENDDILVIEETLGENTVFAVRGPVTESSSEMVERSLSKLFEKFNFAPATAVQIVE